MAEKITANIGFEKQIWDAACALRGSMDASEYKHVILGLIFLKYISDRFEDKYQALVAEGDGFEEDVDEYTSEGIFFVPAGARWKEIAAKAQEYDLLLTDPISELESRGQDPEEVIERWKQWEAMVKRAGLPFMQKAPAAPAAEPPEDENEQPSEVENGD